MRSLITLIDGFNWTVTKMDIDRVAGVSDDAMHVLSGMVILTIAAFVLRRPPWSWRPWLMVLAAETINELYDLTQTRFPTDEGNLRASFHDFWLTLAWPTVILLLYPHFVRLEHEGGLLVPLRRLWHHRAFRIGLGGGAVIGLLAGIYFW